jgi:hypothetical protein
MQLAILVCGFLFFSHACGQDEDSIADSKVKEKSKSDGLRSQRKKDIGSNTKTKVACRLACHKTRI